jgi:hypothetical protein
MTEVDNGSRHLAHWSWRKTITSAILTGTMVLLVIYFIFPGFVLGLCFRTHLIDPQSKDLALKKTVNALFMAPFFLGEQISVIGAFYEWQCYVISGYR